MWRLPEQSVLDLARAESAAFRAAEPFPHAVLDGLFEPDALDRVRAEFPDPSDGSWKTYTGEREGGKQEAGAADAWGPVTRELVETLTSESGTAFLRELTGIDGLVGDTHGGGLHQSGPGARLAVHVDFNRHPRLDLDRRLNLLVYLNPGWPEAAGGSLELWDGRRCVRRITPEFNRCVVFETSDRSYHGHPVPVADGVDPATGAPWCRRSIAVYYYTRPTQARRERHSTIWLGDATAA